MDMIWLIGVECRVRLGVPDWERKKAQKIWLDIGLEVPLAEAGRSDDVRDTVDYWAIEKEARKIAESGEYRLAERLAWRVAEGVLRCDRRLRAVQITAHKRPKVMPKTREVLVTLSRRRKRTTSGSPKA